jgi:ABC-type dipeptide/oligopeptide/nickel transport system permease component
LAGNLSLFGDALAHLALPAFTLGLPLAAYLSPDVRRSVGGVYRLGEEFGGSRSRAAM